MNELSRYLTALIRDEGPISIARYMAEALGNKRHGYYMTRDPLGRAGDFITAPEVSQIFGELIGLWCATLWRGMGEPDPVILAELGPGRGTLMADALRAARVMPGFVDAARLHLVETSPVLRSLQEAKLKASWHDQLDDVPQGPLLLIANEFFDALPVRQLVRTGDGWRQRMVGLDEVAGGFTAVPGADITMPPAELADAPVGSVVEIRPEGVALAADIARRVGNHGGAALIIDYGHTESAAGDTLQAVRGHRYADIFDDPGSADLTAHVDFAALARAAREEGATVHGPVAQSRFLERLGIGSRAEALIAGASGDAAEEVRSGVRRLVAGDQMGRLFKVMAIAAPGLGTPEGFGR